MSQEDSWVVFGAGSFGREVEWLVRRRGEEVVAFVDDGATDSRVLRGLPVTADLEAALRTYPGAAVAIAVANGAARAQIAERVISLGGRCPVLTDPAVDMDSESVEIGEGSIICARSVLTVNVMIGRFVHINIGCTIGHDVVVKDFATIAPGAHVSGRVVIRNGAMIGTGASVIQGRESAPIVVGERSIVGAQACVVRSVPADVTIVGVPAKPVRTGSIPRT